MEASMIAIMLGKKDLAKHFRVGRSPTRPLLNRVSSIGVRVVTWLNTCADYWAAAAMYEQLSALSEAELARRGLSRATLAGRVRAVAAARDSSRNVQPSATRKNKAACSNP
jgi:hypothetical protein